MTKEYRLKISVQNNLLLSAIEDAGYKSQAEFARSMDALPEFVNKLVAMREAPIGRNGEFSQAAKMIMEALGAAPSDLWTDAQLYVSLARNSASAEVGVEEVKRIMGDAMHPILISAPDEFVEELETNRDVRNALKTLSLREAAVLRMRFGIEINTEHTLKEVADKFDVTSEGIRQIEARALRKLRNPSRADKLRVHAGVEND